MEIQEIKSRLPLSQVLDYYHLQPDRQQRLHCPFLDDKTPSMQVYQKTNTCYCFSSNCKTHGKSLDVIDFIMYMENSSKHEAILQAKTMLTGSTEANAAKASPKPPQQNRVHFLRDMFSYFTKGLHGSRPARSYLQQRGLDRQKTEAGYNSWHFHHGAGKDPRLIQKSLQYARSIKRWIKLHKPNLYCESYGLAGNQQNNHPPEGKSICKTELLLKKRIPSAMNILSCTTKSCSFAGKKCNRN